MTDSKGTPREFELRRAARQVGRGLLRRCPNCGSGGLFRRWVMMRESCPKCHLTFDRGERDAFLGGYVVNFVTAELTITLIALAVVLQTWPDVPWNALKWGLILVMVPAPALTYPFAKTVWLAIDLTLRPVTYSDLAGHGENSPPTSGAAAS